MSRIVTVSIALALLGTAGRAQNRISNPDFDNPAGTGGWMLTVGASLTAETHDLHDCPSSGSGLVTGVAGLPTVAWSPCFALGSGETVDVSLWVDTSSLDVELKLIPYAVPGCNPEFGMAPATITTVSFSSAGWLELADATVTAPASTQSARLEVRGAVTTPAAEIYIDRAYVGQPEHVFLDPFEGAEACRWTAAVP